MNLPTIDDIRDAAKRIAPYVHRTPVLTCSALNRMCGADLFFKCENFQKVGAFKIRGATNTAFLLSDEEASKGLATHSSGNHAAAVALAAKWRGTRAFVVMPESSPDIKKNAVAGYGAEIVFCKPTLEAREKTLVEVVERTGAVGARESGYAQVRLNTAGTSTWKSWTRTLSPTTGADTPPANR